MKSMVKAVAVTSIIAMMVVFMNCGGGGGGGGTNPPPVTNAAVTGTVAGTTVIAYTQGNTEVARNTATGNPKTFLLSLPTGTSYKFYLVENEGTADQRIYPLYQDNTNVFSISSAVTVTLGFVDTSSGLAVPANNPLTITGVVSQGEDQSIPTNLSASAFRASDFTGTWNYLGLISGYTPTHNPGWYYGSFTFDTSGTVVSASTITDSMGTQGYTPNPGASFALMPSGVITLPSITEALFKGYMNHDKNSYIGTGTFAPGDTIGVHGYNLHVAVKSGGTYTTSDLEGEWIMHQLKSGPAQQDTGWSYGTATISSNGTVSFTSASRSNLDSSLPPVMQFSLSSDGFVTITPLPQYHGVMTPDKAAMFATVDSGGSEYYLAIMLKRRGSYTLADLQGTWTKQMLAAGDGNRWVRGTANIDGNGTHTWTSIERAYAGNALPVSESLAISPDGIITSTTNTSIHGVMSQDKRMTITTSTEETVPTRYKLTISQK